MRKARIKVENGGFYHVMSRVIEGRSIFGTSEKEKFRDIMRQMEAFCGLNPFRSGMVEDPKDYRYCGYGEAMGGSKLARDRLEAVIMDIQAPWSQTREKYRQFLYMQGEEKGFDDLGNPLRRGFSREEVKKVLEGGGELPMADILRCRVRYFSDGLVLGGKDFVEGVFARHRTEFGLKRKTGARPMKFGQWNGLCTMRDLRNQVVSV